MIDFLIANWKYIAVGVCSLILLIVAVLTKKTKIIDNSIVAAIVDLTIEAEKKYGPGNGEIKLAYVLSKLVEMYPASETPLEVYKSLIEHVLSSPQKKGD